MNFAQYEREGQGAYATFASTVAAILRAAIRAEGGYRLQQVKERAKDPISLLKKLRDRGIADTSELERDIKDLAGCRVVFYTNGDITRFINSGVVHQNFEVLDVKLHHPRREGEDASDLYISNHYLVQIAPNRIQLPEYASFAGMRCEIQLQTILNHAWAEMAHDTIYKGPDLEAFGGRAFEAIKSRLSKVARKYLLPAGYEFQQIAHDFERLIQGKELFDGEALEAIVAAADNNVRAEAIETFAESVLPFYDDLPAMYPTVVARLLAAADVARTVLPAAIETPYGGLPPKTYTDIVKAIAGILKRYRYVDLDATFDGLVQLYGAAESDDERQPLISLGKALAKHEMDVWRLHGPAAQAALVDRIASIEVERRAELGSLLNAMLAEVLGSEVDGTTSSSSAVTFHHGAVIASEALRDIRTKAISLLKAQFAIARGDADQRRAIAALQVATRPPYRGGHENALAQIVMEDVCTVIAFETEIAPQLSLAARQTAEAAVHRWYWSYEASPPGMAGDQRLAELREQVQKLALSFRDLVNADDDFVKFKVLVGFESVYSPAWVDKSFAYRESEAYRAAEVDRLVASVDKASAAKWFDRVARYARTESDDDATFPVFGKFLERLAAVQPAIVLNFIDQLEEPLANFLPGMLSGLLLSAESAQARQRVDLWLAAGKHIGRIGHYLRFVEQFDEALLHQVLGSAIQHDDKLGVRNALVAAVTQFEAHPGVLIDTVFVPALRFLAADQDFGWVRMSWFSWHNNPLIKALDEAQASIVLDALIPYPDIEDAAEEIAGSIAQRWPGLVIDFFGWRQEVSHSDRAPSTFDAVPFDVHALKEPLAAVPELLLAGARKWFNEEPVHFPYDGGRLLASVFPGLGDGLEKEMWRLVQGGAVADLGFALAVLSAFEGKECVYALVRSIVAADAFEGPLLEQAHSVLRQSGVVAGAFGFAELHDRRKALLEHWLDDASARVRAFAAEHIKELEAGIASETRAAESSAAMRKLAHGEELTTDGPVPT